MKKSLLLALGCAFVLAGCGSTNTAEKAETQTEATTEAATEESTADSETETSSEEEATTEDDASSEEEASDAESSSETETEENDDAATSIDEEELTPDENGVVSNGFISITMPADCEGTYLATSYENSINIYDKASSEAGFGGFAFNVSATDSYDNLGGMKTKIGELTDGDGKLFQVYISYPSDVQWDYISGEEMPESYAALYKNAEEIAATLQAVNGGTYADGAGTKGEDIFGDYVKEIITTIENAKDANELEAADLSPMYYSITQGDEAKDPMEAIGVCYADINVDGIDEMFIGDMDSNEIYDVYTSIDGEPSHVVSGHNRDYFKIYGTGLVEYVLESAGVTSINLYDITPNTTEMLSQVSLKVDETADADDMWSTSYDYGETWESITEEEYKDYMDSFENMNNKNPHKFTALKDLK